CVWRHHRSTRHSPARRSVGHAVGLLLPDSARLECRDNLLLVAASVTAHQDFAVLGIFDRQAWLAILMGGAPCHPRAADLATTECPGDDFSGHSGSGRWHTAFSTVRRVSLLLPEGFRSKHDGRLQTQKFWAPV